MPNIAATQTATSTNPWISWPRSVLRILLGVVFILGGTGKLLGMQNAVSMLHSLIERGQAMGIYQTFLVGLVAPNATLAMATVAAGELLLGLALVLGARVRLATGLGLFMMFNFALAKGLFSIAALTDWILIVLLALMFVSRAGNHFGFDSRRSSASTAESTS